MLLVCPVEEAVGRAGIDNRLRLNARLFERRAERFDILCWYALVGATHEKARIVRDGNVITAGGVTSGIDFGLSVVAEIAGETAARTIQLGIEYDPDPPFASGHPDRAPDDVKEAVFPRYEKARAAFRDGIGHATAEA